MSENYPEQLHRAWVGERQGEAFFAALADLTTDQEMEQKWTALAELERRVGIALERIVEIPPNEHVDTEETVAAAGKFAEQPLIQGLATIEGVIDNAVTAYNAMRDSGPSEHAVELDILARHEIALQTFVRREVALDSDNSMEEVDELLQELRANQ